MALDWIKSHKELEHHPKTLRFMSLMDWSLNEAIGFLHRFWWWALDVAPDGVVSEVCRPEVMAGRFGFKQSIGQRVIDSLKESGWVDLREDGTIAIHNHDKRRSSSQEKREGNRERKRRQREKESESRSCHDDVTRDGHAVTLLEREREEDKDKDKETTLSLMREEKKDSGIGEEWVSEPNPIDEIPESLLVIGREIISQMPEGQIKLLLLDGHRPDWIELALKECGFNDVRGQRSIPYARKMLQNWNKIGRPTVNDNRSARKNNPRSNESEAKAPDYSTVVSGEAI